MGNIKPIETEYNGYRFRSRLEARWAVFFNVMGIRYLYENEGYKIGMFYGEHNDAYLPDFYLPDFDVYAEIKGSDEQLEADSDKLGDAIDFESTPMSEKGLIILGQIPFVYCGSAIPYFDILFWQKGVCSTKCLFDIDEHGARFEHGGYCSKKETANWWAYNIADYFDVGAPLPSAVSTEASWQFAQETCFADKDIFGPVNLCYKLARQARFEHGEKPCTNRYFQTKKG